MRSYSNPSSVASRSDATPFLARVHTCECERGREPLRLSAAASARSCRDNVFQVVKRLLREHHPATVPGLPPFTAGAVGYFAYDVVRQLEKIGDHAKDDLGLPDAELMFFDRLLAFDHLRHQIHIMAAADVKRESPRRAYDRAVRDIGALERKLAAGLSSAMWRKSSKAKRQTQSACRHQARRIFCGVWSVARNTLPPATSFRWSSRSASTLRPKLRRSICTARCAR